MDQKKFRTVASVAVAIVLLVVFLWQLSRQEQTPVATEADANLLMGNPSGATTDPANPDNYLMAKPYFALSYNDSKGTPNWVSWCLREADLGPAPRSEFFPDPDLPQGFRRIRPADYTNSGFDRGHVCPRGDRTSTQEAAHATFVMTNIIPQAPSVTQPAWADLEDYCRTLVTKKHQTLYIVAGPQGRGGTGTGGPAQTIAAGKVTVPAKCWKVVLALDGGTGTAADLGRVGPGTRTIAVVMPNQESVGREWADYRTSVREVETLTGYRFFDRVAAEVIDPLKAKVDDEPIAAGHPKGGD